MLKNASKEQRHTITRTRVIFDILFVLSGQKRLISSACISRYELRKSGTFVSTQNKNNLAKNYPCSGNLWQKTLLRGLLPIFVFGALTLLTLSVVLAGVNGQGNRAEAVTANTLNFQGRLRSNTGSTVPDGSYNIEFNLYTVASGGTTEWTETHTNQGGNAVTVQNGYFSVDLGNATSGTAFPGTINWDQEHWLGMTVRGTGAACAFAACTPTDAEMTPRFKLTAVPYAFRAGALVDASGNAKTADQFAQISPSAIQTANSAVAALRLSQAGAGGFVQFQNGGTDVFAVSNTGATTLGSSTTQGQLTLHDGTGNTTTLTAGDSGVNLNFTFPVNDGVNGQCLKTDGNGVLSFDDCGTGGGGGGGGGSMNTILKTVNEVQNNAVNPTATLQNDDELFFPIAANETKVFRFVIQANANATPDIKFAVTAPTGATCVVGATEYETGTSNSNLGCGINTGLMPGATANEMYEVMGTITNGATAGNVTLQWAQNTANAANVTVYAGSYVQETTSGTSTSNEFMNGGNSFGGIATLGTTDAFGLNIITNGSTAQSISSSGDVDFVNNVTIGTGLVITSGGIDNNNGGITDAGAISGVTSVTSTGGLTVQSGGSGDITIDSASNVVILADDTLRRAASGTTTIDLLDTSGGTTLAIVNSDGGQVAGLTVEGAITASSFSGDGTGLTSLDGSAITSGTVGDAYLSTNVSLLNSNQTFSALKTFGAGLILGNSTSTSAGAVRWSGTDFEGYDGIQWVSLTSGGGGGGGGGASQSITIEKTTNEVQNSAVNPTATLQNDDELFFPIGANETWSFRFTLLANANATPDFKFAVTAPVGATCQVGMTEYEAGTSNSNLGCGASSGLIPGSTANEVYEVVGTITNGATAGNVTLQWAQNTVNAANVTVYAGSYLLATSGDTPVPGSEYVQGGNAFGATGVIGTTDAEDFNLIANNSTRLSLTAAGQAVFSGEILANNGLTIGNAASDGLTIVSDSIALTNGLNFDSNTFVINSSTDFVGINSASPTNRLTINTANTTDSLAEVMLSPALATNKGLVVQGAASQSANLFEVQNSSGNVLAGFDSSGSLVLGLSSVSSSASSSRTVTLPDASGTVCLSLSTACGFLPYATGSYVTDGTTNDTIAINKTGASGNLMALQKSGGAVFTVSNTGSLQIQSSDTAALDIRNVGGTSYFSVDTSTGQIRVGPSVADGLGVLFTLDTKNNAGDPTGVEGSMYYNSNLGKFRCYENAVWKDCISTISLRSFIDSTSDAVVDANTTNYWDLAAENNNSTPNITLSQASGKAVMGIVTMEVSSTSNNDLEVTARVERGIGSAPTCNSGTQVGAQPGVFSSNNGGQKASTITFMDTPNTTTPVYYVVCSDTATVGTTGNVTRLRVTLQEVSNSN